MSMHIFVMNMILSLIVAALFGGTLQLSLHTGGYWLFPILFGCTAVIHLVGVLTIGVKS